MFVDGSARALAEIGDFFVVLPFEIELQNDQLLAADPSVICVRCEDGLEVLAPRQALLRGNTQTRDGGAPRAALRRLRLVVVLQDSLFPARQTRHRPPLS